MAVKAVTTRAFMRSVARGSIRKLLLACIALSVWMQWSRSAKSYPFARLE